MARIYGEPEQTPLEESTRAERQIQETSVNINMKYERDLSLQTAGGESSTLVRSSLHITPISIEKHHVMCKNKH